MMAAARAAVLNYEQRHGLEMGSLVGGGGAGAAPCASPDLGQPAPPGSSEASSSAAAGFTALAGVAAGFTAGLADGPPQTPLAGTPPDLESLLFAPDEGSVWGGAVQALPSQVFKSLHDKTMEVD